MGQMPLPFSGPCSCRRCGRACQVQPVSGSHARMLKRAGVPHGLCVNCAVHDTLRNLYPANLILARSGPTGLSLPHIQQSFFAIAKASGTDASFDEIDWQAIIDNWDLPFPTKLKPTGTNPVREEELALARLEGEQRRAGTWKEPETEEEYQTRRQAAEQKLIDLVRRQRRENP